MNRVVLAAFALLAGHACAAADQTTTMGEERRLMGSTTGEDTVDPADPVDVTSAAVRSGGLATMLFTLLTFLYVGSAVGAAVDESTTIADQRRLMESTTREETVDPADPVDVTSAAVRSGGLATMLFTLLTFLYVGSAVGAAVDESTTVADQRRLMESTTGEETTTLELMVDPADPGDVTSAAVRSGGLGTMFLALLTFLFGSGRVHQR